jgi:hypothetical protein
MVRVQEVKGGLVEAVRAVLFWTSWQWSFPSCEGELVDAKWC